MQQVRDPAIRLFGQKISRPEDVDDLPTFSGGGCIDVDKEEEQQFRDGGGGIGQEAENEKDPIDNEDSGSENGTEKEQEADLPPPNAEETKNSSISPEAIVNPETSSIEDETAKSKSEQSDAAKSQEKTTLKKPDKVIPCPRCNSMDTKFCYYNNYNVNQPRYFCKACQRYWTSGGTMRNVPVGAGRRKNKNSASHFGHITISEALQAARIDAHDGTTHLPALKTNGRVLSFGLDGPICDSMASVLNLGENKVLNQTLPLPCKSGENGDDCSSATSSITASSSVGESNKSSIQNNGFIPQLPCIPSVPWPYYTWNTTSVPSPAMCPSGFLYPAAFWNCSMPGNWNVPWFPSNPAASNPNSPSSGPNSPTLGKHSRDFDDASEKDSLQNKEPSKQRNGCVLTPKTLRIDDPNEAAKSSIWATLGIKNESLSGGGMFKAFQSTKGDEKNHVEASSVLRANPAALSRSLNFHENS